MSEGVVHVRMYCVCMHAMPVYMQGVLSKPAYHDVRSIMIMRVGNALCYTARYSLLYNTIICYAMLCYAVLCYAMLHSSILCYAILHYSMLCLYYSILSCAMLCYATLQYVMLCYTMGKRK